MLSGRKLQSPGAKTLMQEHGTGATTRPKADWPPAAAPSNPAPRPGARILIVEDDPDVADLLRSVAEKSGFAATVAPDAETFRRSMAMAKPDLITLDMKIPGGDGVELIRWISRSGTRASVVLISGADSRTLGAARRLAVEQGINIAGVLEKPLGVGDLQRVLDTAGPGAAFPSVADLIGAIDNRQMFLEYQPKILLTDQWQVESVEALVRWDHPTRGKVYPDVFLPAIEQHGLMPALTDYVLEESFQQCAKWQKIHPLSVAVNLHPSLLSDLDFPDRAQELLNKHALRGENLIVEVTESGTMAVPTASMEILTRLRLMGFRVSMDDFGTGYSSLLQLHRMPFSEIKIDKSFVMNLEHDREARTIVRAIAELGRNLELATCAEGVETQAALAHVRDSGCDIAQGFLFSRSLAAGDVGEFLTGGFDQVRAASAAAP